MTEEKRIKMRMVTVLKK